MNYEHGTILKAFLGIFSPKQCLPQVIYGARPYASDSQYNIVIAYICLKLNDCVLL